MADTYAVTGQVPTTTVGPSGTFVETMDITFTTKPSGVVGRVAIPMSHYTPAEVDKVIVAAAATIESVQAL